MVASCHGAGASCKWRGGAGDARKGSGMAKGKYHDWLEPDGLLRLEAWARDGLTDEQIAKNCGVTTTTLYNWKAKHLAIFEALKRGKEVVDIEVENALLKRALGYSYEEKTYERRKVINLDEDEPLEMDTELVLTKVVTKEVQPDTTAQIFWLKNRRPVEWRDKQQIDANLAGVVGDFTLKITGEPDGED